MQESISRITGEVRISRAKMLEIKSEAANVLDFKTKIEDYLNMPVTEILEVILAGGINLDSSDIHIEPEEKRAKIRVRIDGILQDVLFFEKETYKSLLSRIKLLSGLKLNISDRPQDGRFSVLLKDLIIEIRASSLPAEHGESIVLRILNPKNLIELESLGLRKDLLNRIEKEIRKPNGMIIVTGPTGCGKTTTLYAFLRKIENPGIKIITIEDPIEYHLKGISQTQVDPQKGYDFASGLKSVMRQDPDVILVGEIRDKKTVKTALQAALTGHLVLTTVHTNDAAGVVSRLTSLGANLANIGPALNTAIAQRLVRRVCSECKKFETPTPEELKKLKKELKSLKLDIPKITKNVKIPKTKGCKDCNFTGYKGRAGVFEMFLVDDEMEKFILKNPAIVELRNLAAKKGMITMRQDGFIKVLQGITTIEEVERVVGE
jgi:type II secretory ATPase GspE/PulE/Tfp pilus assembly ATPase PilB-like protein